MYRNITILSLAMLLAGMGCAQQKTDPQSTRIVSDADQISYGSDLCAFTNETIETVRYGGKIVMKNGTVHTFMSAECLAGFYLAMEDKSQIASMKIVDFAQGKQLLPVDELVYLNSRLRPSPNGMFLTAVDASNEKMKTYIYDAYPGPYLKWDQVLELVRKEWDLSETKAHINTN